jgi:hypothetical protein
MEEKFKNQKLLLKHLKLYLKIIIKIILKILRKMNIKNYEINIIKLIIMELNNCNEITKI